MDRVRRTSFPAGMLIATTVLLGGGSFLLLGLFLWDGAPGWVELDLSPGELLFWDAALCVAFCVQHSVMVRRGVRRRVERIVPTHYYGAVFTLASAAMLSAMVLLWQESSFVLVRMEGAARWLVRAVFLATLPGFLWGARSIPRFDPLGLGPIRARLRGREPERWPLSVRGPYRWVRHPQYFLTLVLVWSCPELTADRLLFNTILTVWVVLGTTLEERNLVVEFGADYVEYRRQVPMLIPWRRPARR